MMMETVVIKIVVMETMVIETVVMETVVVMGDCIVGRREIRYGSWE